MSNFVDSLNYTSVNEDSNSEIRSLKIQNSDKILCITGSGTRTLDLLTQSPTQIDSVDYNPCQSYLLELKLAAIKNLEYEEFLDFLGVSFSDTRVQIYRQIRGSISVEARDYWDRNLMILQEGVFYKGRWENYFSLLALFINLTRKQLLQKLFNCTTISEQYNLWRSEWNNIFWQSFLKSISPKLSWKYFLRDPGFYKYLPKDLSIYTYLRQRLNSAAENILFSQSPFATLLFKGKLDPTKSLPPHLQKQNYDKLKEFLSRVKIVTASIINYLENNKHVKYDGYSLSDISSYTGIADYNRLWTNILKTASNRALICERQFLVKRDIPKTIVKRFLRDNAMENNLLQNDQSIFYSFVVAKIL